MKPATKRPSRAGRRSASRFRRTAKRVTKGLQRKPYDGVTPRPSWHRYFQAYSALLDDGGQASETAIAKLLGITRMSLWRIHRRNPGLRRWVHEQFRDRNEFLVGPVVGMLGSTAIRNKSPKHAELFLKAMRVFDRRGDEGSAQAFDPRNVTMNFLIPRPADPVLQREEAKQMLPPPMTFDVAASKPAKMPAMPKHVPEVSVR